MHMELRQHTHDLHGLLAMSLKRAGRRGALRGVCVWKQGKGEDFPGVGAGMTVLRGF